MAIERLIGVTSLAYVLSTAAIASDAVKDDPIDISPPSGRIPSVYLGPRMLDPVEHRIGQAIDNHELTGIDGAVRRLHKASGERGTVVVVRDPECPVSQRYGPRIKRLATQFADGFGFVFIYPNVDLSAEQRAQDAGSLGVDGTYTQRGSFTLAESLGVNSTGDVFVLDAQHRLRYRGAVDDQYGLGYTRDFPTAHYLRNALDDLSAGRPVSTPATSAPGCYIDADHAKDQLLPQVPGDHLLSALTVATARV